ncbi:hypothetical protein D3C80_2202770 [compost metagenome]
MPLLSISLYDSFEISINLLELFRLITTGLLHTSKFKEFDFLDSDIAEKRFSHKSFVGIIKPE